MKLFRMVFLMAAAALLCSPSAGLPAPGGNPHFTTLLCRSCHLDEKLATLVEDNPVALCGRCHNEGTEFADHHPLHEVPDDFVLPEEWPLREGKLTCMTCHLHCTEEDYREQYMLLRGGPDPEKQDFCGICHPRGSFTGRNPHEEINRNEGCELCHTKRPEPGVDTLATVTFLSKPSSLCLLCHENFDHPAGARHTITLGEKDIESVSREVNLYRGREILCSTCHNPHIYEAETPKFRSIAIQSFACPGCHKV